MEPSLTELARALGVDGQSPEFKQRPVAHALGNAMLASLTRNAPYAAQAQLGQQMLDAMFPEDEKQADARMRAVQAQLAELTDPAAQRVACDMLARLGHMHQMAGLIVRDLVLEAAPTRTTAQAFLDGKFGSNSLPYIHVDDAVASLNKPRLELTFTGHPTNTNCLSSMIAQREIGQALHDWRNGTATDVAVKKALDQYANAPLLPERAGAMPGLTVRDETQTMLYFLNNAYSDIDTVYAGYDRALGEKFPEYDPSKLRLGLRYHSWGSSADKDGNANVNADTTLYALAAHYQQILLRYREDLSAIAGLDDWKEKIDHAQRVATGVQRAIEAQLDEHGYLEEATFNGLRDQLREVVAPLDRDAFIAALEQQPASPTVTSLIRHVHGFGFSFGTMEYRETSEEFERIVKALIPDYPADEQGRRDALSALLADPAKLAEFRGRFAVLGSSVEGKPFNKEDVAPIAYHTRKRLELARDFPQAIDNHVLAECQDASNLLELLLLQKSVASPNGTEPHLGIVPLFEDSGPLERAPDVLKAALSNPHYRHHVDQVAAVQHARPAQQMQLAHSDNARRNGLPAARGLIYRAHQQLRAAMADINAHSSRPVDLQFYEGGSLSDPYRGGVRAISAAINEYGLHDFAKMTVQGGDLLNYCNLPDSMYRFNMRNITHNAARLEANTSKSVSREEPVINALIDTKDDYKALFQSSEINDFAEAIGFAEETRAGNTSSRAGARPNGGHANPKVDVTKARTISFSEGFQHAGLTPTWVGSKTLPATLQQHGIASDSPRAMQQYYRGSPVFKDTTDRMLYGLVRSDMPYLDERSDSHPLMNSRLKQEYGTSFKLSMESYTGKPLAHFTKGRELSPKEQHDLLIDEVYPHVKDVFGDQDRFMALGRSMKRWATDAEPNDLKPMLIHNALDTVLHGRMPLLDDPTYATLYCDRHGITRPHGPAKGAHLSL